MTLIPAAARTLTVLTTLAKASQPMTATAIAQRVGMPRSSTYQLLDVLAEQGFVTHYPEQARWGLGVAAFELGSAYLRQDPLQRLAQPLVQQLVRMLEAGPDAQGFSVAVQFGILDGADLVYLLKEISHPANSAQIAVVTEVGVRLPAHLTASGRAILAQQPPAQQRAILAGLIPAGDKLSNRTGLGPETLPELRELLLQEAEQGYSLEHGFVTQGYSTLAVAVRNHLGLATAAFGITFRSGEVPSTDFAKLVGLLSSHAERLSHRLGAA